jgi:hypothetical protein
VQFDERIGGNAQAREEADLGGSRAASPNCQTKLTGGLATLLECRSDPFPEYNADNDNIRNRLSWNAENNF